MPNGKIVVFTGLLPVAQNEAAVAAVLGHEVGHVVGRHAAERISQTMLTQLGLRITDAALAASNTKYRPLIVAGLGLGAQYGVLLPFSREHESEADRLGLLYMAKAGYDPEEAIGLWERMEAKAGAGPWEFLSTHPSPATRRAQLREWLPEARAFYADRSRPLPIDLKQIAAVRAEREQRVALAPIAAKPSLEPGFWYRIRSSRRSGATTYRVDRFETCGNGRCLVVVADTGTSGLYTVDYELVEIRNTDGSATKFTPPLPTIRWPLRVGAKWSESVTIESSSGKKQTTKATGEVLAYESITVPAGSFMAFKISLTLGGRLFREAWYAPETRTYVKTVQQEQREGAVTAELLDYQKSDVGPSQ